MNHHKNNQSHQSTARKMSEDSSQVRNSDGRNLSGKQQPTAAASKLPKRPLSAYNIFFQHERDRILRSCSTTNPSGGRSQVDHDLAGHCTLSRDPSLRVDRSKKSRPPPHGKIAFAELARNIGRKWRKLDGAERSYYQMLAKKEKSRYERELAEYYGIGITQPINTTLPPLFKGDDETFLSSPGIQDFTRGTEVTSPAGLVRPGPIAHFTSATSNGHDQDEKVTKKNDLQCIHPSPSAYSSARNTQSWERFVQMNTPTTVGGKDQAQDIAVMKKSTSLIKGNVASTGTHTIQPLLHALPTSVSDVASLPAAEGGLVSLPDSNDKNMSTLADQMIPSCSASSSFLARQQEQPFQPQKKPQRQQEQPLIIGNYYDPFPLLPGKPCDNGRGISQPQLQLDDSSTTRLPLPQIDLNLEMQDMLSRLLESDQFWEGEK